MSLKDWPASERPRERLLQLGAQYLSDAELLAIFMGSGHKPYTAVDLSRMALQRAGNLQQLLGLGKEALLSHAGFGTATYCQLQAALELGNRYVAANAKSYHLLHDTQHTHAFLRHRLQPYSREVFACLLMDCKCRLLHYQELFYGTVNQSQIHVREIVKLVLHHNAVGLIIAHNHPFGNHWPSDSDIEVTELIKQALALIEVPLWDHIIVGQRGNYSFREMGKLL